MQHALRPLSFYTGTTPLIEQVTERDLKREVISSMFLAMLEMAETNTAVMELEAVGDPMAQDFIRGQLVQQEEAIERCKDAWEKDDLMGVEDAWLSLHAITERIWQ